MGVHIIIFIKPDTNIDFSKLINDLYNNYKEIGKGILIEKTANNINQPNFIFNHNKDLQIDGNNHHITLNIFESYETIKQDIVEMLWDAFDLNDIEFTQVGYIKEIINNEKNFDIEGLKQKFFKDKELLDTNEFQLAYHTEINFKHDNLNCWKRFIKLQKDFIINYDINTLGEDKNINYKYIKEFLMFCDEFTTKELNYLITNI